MKLLVSFGSVVTLGLGFGLGLAALNSNADAIRINADNGFESFMERQRMERNRFRF
jgi:hypothetical protein